MIAEAVAMAWRGVGRPAISVALVGSMTTGEFNRRLPLSDADVLLVVEDDASISIQDQLRRRLLRQLQAACPGQEFGIRVRKHSELLRFEMHMRSWGYDLRRFAWTVRGREVRSLFSNAAPAVTDAQLFRNMLERSWCDLLYFTRRATQDELLAAAARSVLDLLTLALLLRGESWGTHWERVRSVENGALRDKLGKRLPLLEQCWQIKTGAAVFRSEQTLIRGLIDVSNQLMSELVRGLWSARGVRREIGAWFPLASRLYDIQELTPRTVGLDVDVDLVSMPGATAIVPTMVFVLASGRAAWHSLECRYACGHVKTYVAAAEKALRVLAPAVARSAGDLPTMCRAFARLRLARCPAARRDLTPHLSHVASASF